MIFQKKAPVVSESDLLNEEEQPDHGSAADEVETVVGPSVNVEGDLSSAGNIVVKGTVCGNVHTTKHLSVERGAKIIANVQAGSALVSGEVRGNMKIKDAIELTPSARLLGDVSVKTLTVAAGAIVCGKITMPGIEAAAEKKSIRTVKIVKKPEEESPILQ